MADVETMSITCSDKSCGQDFVVTIPPAEVVNTHGISMVFWGHAEPQNCPHCGRAYQMQVKRIEGVSLLFGPVRMQSDSKLIIPPSNFKLPQ
jgi:hypothetical protein